MWFVEKNTGPKLSEELVERIWDLNGRLKQLEATLDERLDELAKRYRRAEQSENRLEAKRAASPCDDDGNGRKVHPYIAARQKRRDALNARVKGAV